jgi:hypothetical protein
MGTKEFEVTVMIGVFFVSFTTLCISRIAQANEKIKESNQKIFSDLRQVGWVMYLNPCRVVSEQ